MSETNCARCIYYVANATQLNQGECHRYPPQLVAVSARTVQGTAMVPGAMFPAVASIAFCGEFEAKPVANS